ncbi:MAG: PQQ-binding-like beta-propeller repeat protein [Planctomycetes bacterium]|nr:PQQ-binding-like beta-propeller repeat protein [Planctomycetota bacterium]
MTRILPWAIALLFFAPPLSAGNWPSWRGPHATGIADERELPLTWSRTENVRWKAPLPAPGNSTPIVWQDRVFLTVALDQGKERGLMCFDRNDGQPLWQRSVHYPEPETTHRDNPFCSGSPVTDGQRVYASFDSAGVAAYDFDGKLLWHRELGKLTHVWGKASSPILYRDLLIVYRGPGVPTHLVALDKLTGQTVWDVEERGVNSGTFGSWSTPLVIASAARDELIMPLPEEMKAYDPATGKELWRCAGLGTEIYSMPLLGEGLAVGVCGHNGPAMAVRLGGQGDVTGTHRLWLHPQNPQRVGSGVIDQGLLYLANATGIAECLEAATGKTVWKERLGGTLWGSMLLADGKLYVSNLEGQTFILAAGPQFRLLATNNLEEPMKAAPAASDGQLFLRTYENLYCIEQRREE